ncbi:NAD(P)H-dependent oxidoreductase [uncultured Flavobacterium sp.]|uniref:NAD(P)H-dependent oxidoreductase n=1 Tax=uncultured Flavobacterium sp. TaxID=165435 RepID=UPI0025D070CF|nr:NAD(P)H-dependent oxidoreductase [uncultured Flavobacterium sp.]
MTELLNSLNWRYATKKYDASKKVSAEDLKTLQEATKLSVSAYGLQPYKILVIENQDLREKLQVAAYGQPQITESSQLFVFAIEKNVGEKQIASYMQNISATRGIPVENLAGFSDMIKGSVANLDENAKDNWAKKQAYIALSTLVNTAALLKIDASPMEGFNPAQFDEILGLEKLGLSTAVIAAIGYRHEEDATQHYKKVRKSNEELFINL